MLEMFNMQEGVPSAGNQLQRGVCAEKTGKFNSCSAIDPKGLKDIAPAVEGESSVSNQLRSEKFDAYPAADAKGLKDVPVISNISGARTISEDDSVSDDVENSPMGPETPSKTASDEVDPAVYKRRLISSTGSELHERETSAFGPLSGDDVIKDQAALLHVLEVDIACPVDSSEIETPRNQRQAALPEQDAEHSPPKKKIIRSKESSALSISSVSFLSCTILDGPSWGVVCADEEGSQMDNQAVAVSTLLSLLSDDNRCCYPAKAAGHSNVHYFAIFDGHGDSVAADLCKGRLHEIISQEIKRALNEEVERCIPPFCYYYFFGEQIQKAIRSSFYRMDEEVVSNRLDDDELAGPLNPTTVGSAATVAIITSCRIVVANCGDSRAVLSRRGRSLQISHDHTLDRDDEKARLQDLGVPVRDVARTFQAMGAGPEKTAIFLAQMAKGSRKASAENFSESVIVVDLRPHKIEDGKVSRLNQFEGTTDKIFLGSLQT
ncbi:hypothetical protein Mapa_000710 [Marchantia paleacea]|nr:hypothetical protein Mapa_000710 [Marchantia paleacea]